MNKDCNTEDEHLTAEDTGPTKVEYVRGQARVKPGGTDNHNATISNIIGALWGALRGRECRVMSPDLRVASANGAFFYPDVMVIGGTQERHRHSHFVITNPAVIVEVLARNTDEDDRGEKMHNLLAVPSLRHYALVSQHEPRVEVYTRQENGHWDYRNTQGLHSAITLPTLEITLALAEVYDEIEFTREQQEN